MAIAYPFVDKEYFLIANGEYIEQLKGIGSLQNLHIKKNFPGFGQWIGTILETRYIPLKRIECRVVYTDGTEEWNPFRKILMALVEPVPTGIKAIVGEKLPFQILYEDSWLNKNENKFLSLCNEEMVGRMIRKRGDKKNMDYLGKIERVSQFDYGNFVCFVSVEYIPRNSNFDSGKINNDSTNSSSSSSSSSSDGINNNNNNNNNINNTTNNRISKWRMEFSFQNCLIWLQGPIPSKIATFLNLCIGKLPKSPSPKKQFPSKEIVLNSTTPVEKKETKAFVPNTDADNQTIDLTGKTNVTANGTIKNTMNSQRDMDIDDDDIQQNEIPKPKRKSKKIKRLLNEMQDAPRQANNIGINTDDVFYRSTRYTIYKNDNGKLGVNVDILEHGDKNVGIEITSIQNREDLEFPVLILAINGRPLKPISFESLKDLVNTSSNTYHFDVLKRLKKHKLASSKANFFNKNPLLMYYNGLEETAGGKKKKIVTSIKKKNMVKKITNESSRKSSREKTARYVNINGYNVLREGSTIEQDILDLPKVKKTWNAFNFFAQWFRDNKEDEIQGKGMSEQAGIIGEHWKNTSQSAKQPFFDMVEKDKLRYQDDLKKREKLIETMRMEEKNRVENEKLRCCQYCHKMFQSISRREKHEIKCYNNANRVQIVRKRKASTVAASRNATINETLKKQRMEIVEAISKRNRRRNVYLSGHIETLKPFIETKVRKLLHKFASKSVPSATPPKSMSSGSSSSSSSNNENPVQGTISTTTTSITSTTTTTTTTTTTKNSTPQTISKSDSNSNDKAVTNLNLQTHPDYLKNGTLRSYQLAGVNFLIGMHDKGLNGILADEMGLGKTIQTIAFLSYLKYERYLSGIPSLIVVPLSVLNAWVKEIKKWAPEFKVMCYHSNGTNERERLKRKLKARSTEYDVVVTTYDVIKSKHAKFLFSGTFKWRYAVLDEGHKIKNELSEISQQMAKITSEGKLILTGTPLQNNLHELWALLYYLESDIFTVSTPFDNAFNLTTNQCDNEVLNKAHHLLALFQLRRLKSEVEFSLPKLHEVQLEVDLSEKQKQYAKILLNKDMNLLNQVERRVGASGGETFEKEHDAWKRLNNLLMQLRKVCNHPYCLPRVDDDHATTEDIVTSSQKMVVLDKLLARLKEKGHRVVLFSQFVIMLNIFEEYLNFRGYKYARLDGQTSRGRRSIDLRVFNQKNSDLFIYLMSTRAGGLGINAQTADTVILYDSDWNPQVDRQAQARVHRIGQTKKVHCYRLVTRNTVEERIIQRANKKLYLDKVVNRDSTAKSEEYEKLGLKEMLKILKFGANAIFNNSGSGGQIVYTDNDILKIIDRTKDNLPDARKDASNFNPENVDLEYRNIGMDGTNSSAEAESNDMQKSPLLEPARESPSKAIFMPQLHGKRDRVSTTVEVNGYKVKKTNNYTMQEGGLMFSGSSSSGGNGISGSYGALPQKRYIMKAGRDYDHDELCLICWDGGDLLCCDQCSGTYHESCLRARGYEAALDSHLQPGKLTTFKCPHHSCKGCGRGSTDVGGVLLVCTECPTALCEDCENPDNSFLSDGRCQRFEKLGMPISKTNYYFQCSKTCKRFHDVRVEKGVVSAINDYTKSHANLPVEVIQQRSSYPRDTSAYLGKLMNYDQGVFAVVEDGETLDDIANQYSYLFDDDLDPRTIMKLNREISGIGLNAKFLSGTSLFLTRGAVIKSRDVASRKYAKQSMYTQETDHEPLPKLIKFTYNGIKQNVGGSIVVSVNRKKLGLYLLGNRNSNCIMCTANKDAEIWKDKLGDQRLPLVALNGVSLENKSTGDVVKCIQEFSRPLQVEFAIPGDWECNYCKVKNSNITKRCFSCKKGYKPERPYEFPIVREERLLEKEKRKKMKKKKKMMMMKTKD